LGPFFGHPPFWWYFNAANLCGQLFLVLTSIPVTFYCQMAGSKRPIEPQAQGMPFPLLLCSKNDFPLIFFDTDITSPLFLAAAIISVNKHDFKPSSGPGCTLN